MTGPEPEKDPLDEERKRTEEPEKLFDVRGSGAANTRDIAAYILIILGIVLLFSYPFFGGTLIGLVVGIYFSSEILSTVKSLNESIEKYGMVKSLIVGGLVLAIFIALPSLFIGAAIAVGIKQVFFPDNV